MTLKEFLNSPLLPRREEVSDMWTHESFWGLPDNLCVYSYGFNRTTRDKQSKYIIGDMRNMDQEKYHLLQQIEDYQVKGVTAFPTGVSNGVAVHIMIDISNEQLKELGVEI